MRFTTVSSALRAIPAILLLVASGATFAQSNAQNCPADGPVNRAACLKEMGAAKQASRTGALTSPDQSTLERNALARCSVFKTPGDRSDCEARVRSGQTSGSVPSGGMLLEATTPVQQ